MTRWPRSNLHVVGVMAAPSQVPFDRASVVVERNGELLRVARWDGHEVVGVELVADELQALVDGGEAIRLREPVDAQGMVHAWVLGASIGPQSETIREGVVAGTLHSEEHDRTWFLIVDETGASWRRAEWSAAWGREARRHLALGAGAEAYRLAELSWLVGPTVVPAQIALLVRAGEAAGEAAKGNAVRQLERNTRGPLFDARVAEFLAMDTPRRRWGAEARARISQQLDDVSRRAA